MLRFFYLFLSNNIIQRKTNTINRHYAFNFKKNINKSISNSGYHNFIQNAKINFIGNITREINENLILIESKSKNESIKEEITEEKSNITNGTNLIEEKKDNTILKWKYSSKRAYDGYDMRYLTNDSDIDSEINYENMYKIYKLYNKKKLYDILLSNISIYTKLDYIGKEEKYMLNQNITNGGLYKDWNFDF